jgi:peptide/nickel transport system permease protein
MNMRTELLSPFQSDYILGTDIFGRSLFEVLSAGLVYSISISIIVSFLSCCIGLFMGYFSVNGFKYFKIICDFLTNFIFILPSLLLAILLMSFSGQSFSGLIFVLIFTGWPAYAKLARGETKRILGLCYLEGSRAIGATKLRVLFKIMIPEMLPIFMVHIILSLSGVIISEATLGFLGLGGSEYSWGVLLSMGKGVLLEAPFIVIITSLALGFLIIGLNLLGDGFRDYLDPKS